MRVSVFPDDPGFVPAGESRGYKVWLNGAELRYVCMADDEKGEVVVARLDERGSFIVDRSLLRIAHQTLHGQVRIERV
jgi:hypothetical protein